MIRNKMLSQFVLDAIAERGCESLENDKNKTQTLLIQFNEQINAIIGEHGVDRIGKAIWYLYGCTGDFARDAVHPSVSAGFDHFYRSIEVLYDSGFAKHCSRDLNQSNKLETACYMFWDMDSGLEYFSFNGRPELFALAERLIDFGLSHQHSAIQESFLHCLGHREYMIPNFVHDKIGKFLTRRDIDPKIREYAKAARSGSVL